MKNLASRRPAESISATIAVALLIAAALGITDESLVMALAVALGFVPTAVTWTVEQVKQLRSNE